MLLKLLHVGMQVCSISEYNEGEEHLMEDWGYILYAKIVCGL